MKRTLRTGSLVVILLGLTATQNARANDSSDDSFLLGEYASPRVSENRDAHEKKNNESPEDQRRRRLLEEYLSAVRSPKSANSQTVSDQSERRSRVITPDYKRPTENDSWAQESYPSRNAPSGNAQEYRLNNNDFVRGYQDTQAEVDQYEREQGDSVGRSVTRANRGQPRRAPSSNMTEAKSSDYNQSLYNSAGGARSRRRTASEGQSALLRVKNFVRGYNEESSSTLSEDGDDSPLGVDYKPFFVRLALLGGLSQISSSDTTTQSARDKAELGQNFYLGLGADLGLTHYLGAEVDAFYGIAPSMILVDSNNNETEKTLQGSGALANIRGQWLIPLGNSLLIPNLGLGYGLLSTTEKTFDGTNESSKKSAINGAFWAIGISVLPTPSIILSADYASSLGASGDYNGNSLDGMSPSFNRIRIGGSLRLAPNFLLGVQYIQRQFTTGPSSTTVLDDTNSATGSSTTESQESMKQFVGVLTYEF